MYIQRPRVRILTKGHKRHETASRTPMTSEELASYNSRVVTLTETKSGRDPRLSNQFHQDHNDLGDILHAHADQAGQALRQPCGARNR